MKSIILFLSLFIVGSLANDDIDWSQNEHYLAHEQLIQDINNDKTSTFKAVHYDRFKGLSLEELKQYTGALIDDEHLEAVKKEALKNKDVVGEGDEDLPKNFNVWDKKSWSKCKEVFQTIQDQATCGACYGVGVASALTDRKCIKSNGKDTTQLSSWDIVTCCEECKGDKSDGCKGGYQNRVYNWYKNTGVVSGDKYGGSNCKPYPVKPLEKKPKDYPVAIKFLSSVGALKLETSSGSCKQSCQTSYTKKNYNDDKNKGGGYRTYFNDEKGAMKEIYKNGPITAGFTAYEDLFGYKEGVYSHKKGRVAGGHLVKVVGWGVTDDGIKFWNVVNSWNTTWGDKGYFKMLRGTNDCNFESYMMAGNLNADEEQDPAEHKKTSSDNFGLSNMYVNGFLMALLLKLALF